MALRAGADVRDGPEAFKERPPTRPSIKLKPVHTWEFVVSDGHSFAQRERDSTVLASPTMPWAWGTGLQNPSGPYHDVWSRDLYEIATALIADGDVAGAPLRRRSRGRMHS